MRILAVGVFSLLGLERFATRMTIGKRVEDIIDCCEETLDDIKTYDAIFASMVTYEHNKNGLHAFWKNWCPSTNTISIFLGELSIFLLDLRTIAGLHVHESCYDEVVPLGKKLTHVDDQGIYFFPRKMHLLVFGVLLTYQRFHRQSLLLKMDKVPI